MRSYPISFSPSMFLHTPVTKEAMYVCKKINLGYCRRVPVRRAVSQQCAG